MLIVDGFATFFRIFGVSLSWRHDGALPTAFFPLAPDGFSEFLVAGSGSRFLRQCLMVSANSLDHDFIGLEISSMLSLTFSAAICVIDKRANPNCLKYFVGSFATAFFPSTASQLSGAKIRADQPPPFARCNRTDFSAHGDTGTHGADVFAGLASRSLALRSKSGLLIVYQGAPTPVTAFMSTGPVPRRSQFSSVSS